MSIFSRHCFQFKFSISGRLSPYGFINITFITISSTHRTLLPHNIQNCNSNYFLKSNKLTFKYIFRCSFKTYTVSVKNSWVRPPASTPDKRASHILTCFAKLMDSVKKKTKKKQNRSMSLCIFRYFLYFACCFLFNMSLWLKYLRQNTKKHCSILVLCRRVWQLYFLAFQLLAEADLGLLQNPRWKALHLGCSNSPRSVSDWIYISCDSLIWENCAFPQNFHTRKLSEVTGFLAVLVISWSVSKELVFYNLEKLFNWAIRIFSWLEIFIPTLY